MSQEEPIRVAQVMGKMLGGGVEAVVMNYYRHIDRSRVQFDFLVDSDSNLVPRDEIEFLGGRVFEIPPYQHVLEYQRELQRLFRREGWKIVHSHINSLSVFPLRAALKAGVPVRIAHSHSTWGKGELKKNAMKAVLRPLANIYPTHRFACSDYAGKWLFGNKPFKVLPSAIDCSKFEYSDEKRRLIREEWGIPNDAFVIGHTGRLSPPKNQIFLVRILKDIRAFDVDAYLVLVGEGPDRHMLQDEADKLGLNDFVVMPGFMDTASVYSGFDVFAFPSQYEGFGMAAVEAQAAGLFCIVSDRVPGDVRVSDLCLSLSLDERADWIREICKCSAGGLRDGCSSELTHFDVRNCAQDLCTFYSNL